jgi:hypothetical protein
MIKSLAHFAQLLTIPTVQPSTYLREFPPMLPLVLLQEEVLVQVLVLAPALAQVVALEQEQVQVQEVMKVAMMAEMKVLVLVLVLVLVRARNLRGCFKQCNPILNFFNLCYNK